MHQPGARTSVWRQKICLWQGCLLANLQWDTAGTHAGWGLICSSSVSMGHRWTGKYLWFKNVFWQCRRKYSGTHLTAHFLAAFPFVTPIHMWNERPFSIPVKYVMEDLSVRQVTLLQILLEQGYYILYKILHTLHRVIFLQVKILYKAHGIKGTHFKLSSKTHYSWYSVLHLQHHLS